MHPSRLTTIVLICGGVLAAAAIAVLCWPDLPSPDHPDLSQARAAIARKDYDAVVGLVRGQPAPQAKMYVQCLGQELGAGAEPVLTRLLDRRVEKRPDVRAWSASALNATIAPEQPKDPTAGSVKALVTAMREDPAPAVRASAATTLGYVRAYETMNDLVASLEDQQESVRRATCRAIEKITCIRLNYRSNAPESERAAQIAKIKAWWAHPDTQNAVSGYYRGGRFKAIQKKYSR
ncbi:MAG: HEAT repeat domain-containing protein [Planctomycetaceae bacterium]|nr:HEAT repeat domain-containing protein [Planctomycetaceae bacterium]